METGCQGGQGSPRAVASGGWMDIEMHGQQNIKILSVI